jgi:hypothetical protein
MGNVIFQSLWMYGLAIVISLLIAVLIRGVVVSLAGIKLQAAAPQPAPQAVTTADVSQAHIAAITAAVYAILGAHRIVHIEDMERRTGWTTGGRIMHQTSHHPARSH